MTSAKRERAGLFLHPAGKMQLINWLPKELSGTVSMAGLLTVAENALIYTSLKQS